MRERRLFVDAPLRTGEELVLPDTTARHINQVLRLKRNEEIVLFNGEGGEYLATLIAVKRDHVSAFIEEHLAVERESNLDIRLALGVSRGERMDFAIQKSVELGAFALFPLKTDRSVVKLDGARLDRRQQHWQSIANNACEQSGRNALVLVHPIQSIHDWLSSQTTGLRLTLSPFAGRSLREVTHHQEPITLLIGPEGGLSESEVAASQAHGFEPVQLGRRIMRTETAGVAAIAALQTLWGDFT